MYNDAEHVLAAEVTDIDELSSGRTALWCAVFAHKPDNARVLVDPHRSMMAGWSPARLASDAGPVRPARRAVRQ